MDYHIRTPICPRGEGGAGCTDETDKIRAWHITVIAQANVMMCVQIDKIGVGTGKCYQRGPI